MNGTATLRAGTESKTETLAKHTLETRQKPQISASFVPLRSSRVAGKHRNLTEFGLSESQLDVDMLDFIHNLSARRFPEMTYHDKRLIGSAKVVRRKAQGPLASLLRGIDHLTLAPPSPRFRFRSQRDDVRAIGDDMRRAMRQLETSD